VYDGVKPIDIANHRCAICGYDLHGLRSRGQCPECGAAFNKVSGEGVASGQGETKPAQQTLSDLARSRTGLLAAATLAAIVGVVWWMLLRPSYLPIVVGIWFILLGAAATTYSSKRSQKTDSM